MNVSFPPSVTLILEHKPLLFSAGSKHVIRGRILNRGCAKLRLTPVLELEVEGEPSLVAVLEELCLEPRSEEMFSVELRIPDIVGRGCMTLDLEGDVSLKERFRVFVRGREYRQPRLTLLSLSRGEAVLNPGELRLRVVTLSNAIRGVLRRGAPLNVLLRRLVGPTGLIVVGSSELAEELDSAIESSYLILIKGVEGIYRFKGRILELLEELPRAHYSSDEEWARSLMVELLALDEGRGEAYAVVWRDHEGLVSLFKQLADETCCKLSGLTRRIIRIGRSEEWEVALIAYMNSVPEAFSEAWRVVEKAVMRGTVASLREAGYEVLRRLKSIRFKVERWGESYAIVKIVNPLSYPVRLTVESRSSRIEVLANPGVSELSLRIESDDELRVSAPPLLLYSLKLSSRREGGQPYC